MNNILEIFPQNVTEALGFTLLHSVWQALVLLVIYLIIGTFSKSSSLKYNVGTFLLAAMGIVSLATYYFVYEPTPSLQLIANFENISVLNAGINATEVDNSISWAAISAWIYVKIPYLVNIWVIGLTFYFIRFAYNFWQVNQLKTKDLVQPSAQTLEIFRKLQSTISGKGERLMESSRVYTPVLIGYLKPIILLPVGLCTHLSVQEIEAILAHELAHAKRNDYVVNLVQSVLDIVYFFNPAFIILSNFVREERENCCDEFASKICGGSLPIAKALISLESFRQETYLAMAFGQKRNILKNRVHKILGISPEKANQNKAVFFIIGLLIVGIFYVNIENTFAQNQKPPKKKITKTTRSNSTHYQYINDDDGTNKMYAENEKGKLEIIQKNGTVFVNGDAYKLSAADSSQMVYHQQEIEKLQKEMTNYSEKIGELSSKISEKASKIHLQSEPINQRSQEIGKLSQKMGDLAQKQAQISLKMSKIDESENSKIYKQLESQEAKYAKEMEALEAKIEKLSDEIEDLSGEIDEKSGPIDSLSNEIEKFEKPMEAIGKKIEEHTLAMYKLYPSEAVKAFEKFTGEKAGYNLPVPPPPPPVPAPPRAPRKYNAPPPPPAAAPRPPKAPKAPRYDGRSGLSKPIDVEIPLPLEALSPVALIEPINVELAPIEPISLKSNATKAPKIASKRK